MDKTNWPEGEWHQEPDEVVWGCPETGLLCVIARNMLGSLCGFVVLEKDHPFYGEKPNLEVHGGVSYASADRPAILPRAGLPEDGVWWIGFDCARANDINPGCGYKSWPATYEYRNIIYVLNEVEKLAQQLSKALDSAAKR